MVLLDPGCSDPYLDRTLQEENLTMPRPTNIPGMVHKRIAQIDQRIADLHKEKQILLEAQKAFGRLVKVARKARRT